MVDYKDQKAINGTVVLAKVIHKAVTNIFLTAQSKNGKPWTFINTTLDMCELMEEANRIKFGFPNMLLKQLKDTVQNWPNKCPFKMVGY